MQSRVQTLDADALSTSGQEAFTRLFGAIWGDSYYASEPYNDVQSHVFWADGGPLIHIRREAAGWVARMVRFDVFHHVLEGAEPIVATGKSADATGWAWLNSAGVQS